MSGVGSGAAPADPRALEAAQTIDPEDLNQPLGIGTYASSYPLGNVRPSSGSRYRSGSLAPRAGSRTGVMRWRRREYRARHPGPLARTALASVPGARVHDPPGLPRPGRSAPDARRDRCRVTTALGRRASKVGLSFIAVLTLGGRRGCRARNRSRGWAVIRWSSRSSERVRRTGRRCGPVHGRRRARCLRVRRFLHRSG